MFSYYRTSMQEIYFDAFVDIISSPKEWEARYCMALWHTYFPYLDYLIGLIKNVESGSALYFSSGKYRFVGLKNSQYLVIL